ncbi:MAG: fumarylacetoacetate hydrolase family protein [Pseudomonadota bacterium]|nr:fumarylacetoacetate hydrolase family protein [Pseudomonadota bacterium]
MKLLRFGSPGKEKPGLLDQEGSIRDLSSVINDINGETLSPRSIEQLSGIEPESLPIVTSEPRLGTCVGNIGKLVCIGLNYSDHAKESGMAIPTDPIVFMKAISAVTGPNDNIELIRGSEKTDWEVELGIVIGSHTKYVTEDDALDHVAGYCVVNDISERHWQLERQGNWTKGKSGDTYGPVGPWMVTRDEVSDPQALDLWLDVNGQRMQDGNTETMIFSVKTIVSYLSQCMSLQPGDVIATGTPPGVGQSMSPPVFLKAGDNVQTCVVGLGLQNQTVVEA